jgi:hypothetical protein
MEGNQQPICEAFIMTGESMLKLSRNETEGNGHHHHNNNNNINGNNNNNNNSHNKAHNHNTPTNTTTAIAPSSNNNIHSKHANASGTSESTLDKQTGRRSPLEFKSGPLNRKSIFEPHGKPTPRGRRGWRRLFVTIKDLRMIIRTPDLSQPQAQSQQAEPKQLERQQAAPDNKLAVAGALEFSTKIRRLVIAQSTPDSIKLHHSFAKRETSYTKRQHVFRLRLADQSEFLMQASSEQEMDSWIEMINFASACLSSPALPSAVASGRRYLRCHQKPILPANHTKLTYWQQLIDHEERLQRLKQELEEHLNEAPVAKSADKRSKSEFIDKIASLRQDIERYTVYVELMRKRSNSAEAIILSKNPQNASMMPSTGRGTAPSKSS